MVKEFVAQVSKSFVKRTEYVAQLELQKELDKARARRDRFVDMRIDNLMAGEALEQKYKELTDTIDACKKKLAESQIKQDEFRRFKNRMRDIQNVRASGACWRSLTEAYLKVLSITLSWAVMMKRAGKTHCSLPSY